MNLAALSVRFENVLPSEELLGLARGLWAGLDLASFASASRATLSITRGGERFQVRLAFGNARKAHVEAHDEDPFLAVRHALTQLAPGERGAADARA